MIDTDRDSIESGTMKWLCFFFQKISIRKKCWYWLAFIDWTYYLFDILIHERLSSDEDDIGRTQWLYLLYCCNILLFRENFFLFIIDWFIETTVRTFRIAEISEGDIHLIECIFMEKTIKKRVSEEMCTWFWEKRRDHRAIEWVSFFPSDDLMVSEKTFEKCMHDANIIRKSVFHKRTKESDFIFEGFHDAW